ncbi:MAG: ribosome small subunit-dependent GTPase A [Bacteroidota bacterium]
MAKRNQGNPARPNDPDDQDLGYSARTRQRAKLLDRTRTRVKLGDVPEGALQGTVMRPLGPHWMVASHDGIWDCAVSGVVDVPHTSNLVAVGDTVWILPDNIQESTATIVKVEERTTVLSRKAAGRSRREQVMVANAEQLCIVVAAAQPDYKKRLIDRYLIAADKGELAPMIVVNKIDLIPDEYRPDFVDDLRVYSDELGIPVMFTSTTTGEGISELEQHLQAHVSLLAGPSGVGKSSIINLISDIPQAVGEISRKYDKGRHTTTAAIVIPLRSGGTVIDTPGIREFAHWELGLDELPFYFEEFAPFAENCKFSSCSHTHEPGCAV